MLKRFVMIILLVTSAGPAFARKDCKRVLKSEFSKVTEHGISLGQLETVDRYDVEQALKEILKVDSPLSQDIKLSLDSMPKGTAIYAYTWTHANSETEEGPYYLIVDGKCKTQDEILYPVQNAQQ